LRRVLSNLGNQWLEAVPVLLERLDNPDFETRHWAIFGIWDLVINGSDNKPDSVAQALALYRPKLSAIFRADEEAVTLRRAAYQCLLPTLFAVRKEDFFHDQYAPNNADMPSKLDPETMTDITAVLQSPQKNSRGLQFELLDPLCSRRIEQVPQY